MSKGVPCSSFTDGRTHTHTQTHRVTTEDTLSGFQEFFLQPIIKERSNKTSFICIMIITHFESATNGACYLVRDKGTKTP